MSIKLIRISHFLLKIAYVLSSCLYFYQYLKKLLMSTNHKVSRAASTIIAIIFLIPPAIFFLKWTSLGRTSPNLDEAEKVNIYMGYFLWAKNINMIYYISIICCVIVMGFGARSFRNNVVAVRLLMFLAVFFAAIILLFDLYHLV